MLRCYIVFFVSGACISAILNLHLRCKVCKTDKPKLGSRIRMMHTGKLSGHRIRVCQSCSGLLDDHYGIVRKTVAKPRMVPRGVFDI